MTDNDAAKAFQYYIMKRGLYFRPEAKGYTGIRDEAGLFTKEYATDYCRGCSGELTMLRMDDQRAKEFMPAAYNDLVIKHLEKKRDEAFIAGVKQGMKDALAKSAKVDGLLEALRFYADPASYQFIHGTASYMPIEVDDGYKAKTAIQRFNGEV